jgi:hypothetical protein
MNVKWRTYNGKLYEDLIVIACYKHGAELLPVTVNGIWLVCAIEAVF